MIRYCLWNLITEYQICLNYLFLLNQFTNEWIIFLNEQELSASLRYALSFFGIQKKLFTRFWTGLEQINQANLVFLDYISQTMAYYPILLYKPVSVLCHIKDDDWWWFMIDKNNIVPLKGTQSDVWLKLVLIFFSFISKNIRCLV